VSFVQSTGTLGEAGATASDRGAGDCGVCWGGGGGGEVSD